MHDRRANTTVNVLIAVAIIAAIAIAVFALLGIDTRGRQAEERRRSAADPLELPKIDPALIKYRETDSIPIPAEEVRGLAVTPDGRHVIVGDRFLEMTDAKGEAREKHPLDDRPHCVAVGDEEHVEPGRIYVGMKDHIQAFDPQGKQLASWQTLGENANITSIATSEDDVFVADAGNRVVLRYDTEGKLLGRIGEKDDERNIPGFTITSPYFDLIVSPDGLLRVINPRKLRIEAYTFDGDLEVFWGESSPKIEGFFGCCNPTHLAVLSDGRIVTAEKGVTRVKLYSSSGELECVVAGPEQLKLRGDDVIADLAVDAEDRILVLDPSAKAIRVFEPKAEEESKQ